MMLASTAAEAGSSARRTAVSQANPMKSHTKTPAHGQREVLGGDPWTLAEPKRAAR
jgi:hypothetical protein